MSFGSEITTFARLSRARRWTLAGVALFAPWATPSNVAAQAADVSIVKSAAESPVRGGELTSFTLLVSNAGPDVARGVVVNDSLPAGSEAISATSNTEGECLVLSGTVTCFIGDLEVGESDTIVINVALAGGGQSSNRASVRLESGCDPNVENNVGEARVTVTGGGGRGADLQITQSGAPDEVLVGELVTYSVSVENSGPADAIGVILTDTIPSGTEFVGATSTGPTDCVFLSGTLTCELGDFAVGTSQTVDLIVRPLFSGRKVNFAAIFSETPSSGNLSTNSSTEFTNVIGAPVCSCCLPEIADLDITKTAAPDPGVVGQELTFTITVTNNGPSTATNVLIQDVLPESVSLVSATTSQGFVQILIDSSDDDNGTTVIGAVGTLETGETATLTIVVIPNQFGTLTNTATVTSDQTDETAAADTTIITILPSPILFTDLSITKNVSTSGDDATVKPGEHFTYNITVTNNGDDTSGVVVTDTLPAGIIVVSAGSTQGTVVRSGSTITVNVGTLASGASASITIIAFAKQPGTIINTVTVGSNATDLNEADNTATAAVTVGALTANLSLTKTAPASGKVGEPFVYTLVVTNNGPDSDPLVVITDNLPAGVTFVSGTGTKSTANPIDQTVRVNAINNSVTIQVGRLNAGDSATVQLTVMPTSAGTITNVASARGSRNDGEDAVATASATTVFAGQEANLNVTKTADRSTVGTGEIITYTVVVSNSGPDTATGVVITDQLPANTELESLTASPGLNVRRDGNTLIGFTPTLAVGASVSFTVGLRATGPEGTLINSVTVIADQSDSDTTDNTATVVVPVVAVCCADLTGEWIQPPVARTGSDGSTIVEGGLNVCNIGSTCEDDATEIFLDIYLSDDAVFDFEDTLLQCTVIRVPRGGTCDLHNLSAQLPPGTDLSGKFIIGVIDPTLIVNECREANNYIVVPVTTSR